MKHQRNIFVEDLIWFSSTVYLDLTPIPSNLVELYKCDKQAITRTIKFVLMVLNRDTDVFHDLPHTTLHNMQHKRQDKHIVMDYPITR